MEGSLKEQAAEDMEPVSTSDVFLRAAEGEGRWGRWSRCKVLDFILMRLLYRGRFGNQGGLFLLSAKSEIIR